MVAAAEMEGLTPRSLLSGLAIGSLLCFSNMYFGLQTGWVTMGSIQAAVLGFGLFSVLGKMQRAQRLTVAENVIIQTTAVATATMPLAAGLVGVVPALGMLNAQENPPAGPVRLSHVQLLLWSLALAFFGVFLAAPLRLQTVVREGLRFPSGTATANVIRTLHRAPAAGDRAAPVRGRSGGDPESGTESESERDDEELAPLVSHAGPGGAAARGVEAEAAAGAAAHASGGRLQPGRVRRRTYLHTHPADIESQHRSAPRAHVPSWVVEEGDDDTPALDGSNWRAAWRALLASLSGSGGYTLAAAAVPALHSAPVFDWLGLPGVTEWGWELVAAWGYVGQGMIMGPRTTLSMLGGALTGYAWLGPQARRRGWAPGPVEDWETGAAGWVMWPALAIMLTDSLVSLALLVGKDVVAKARRRRRTPMTPAGAAADARGAAAGKERQPNIPSLWWASGLAASCCLCTAVLSPMLGMPLHQPPVALALGCGVAVVAVRALGETDLNPVTGVGKVSQLVFAVIAPKQVVANLVAGAVAEAGAQQAGDMMQDFKTAHLLRVSPRAQFAAMLVGSSASVGVSVAAYALYTAAWPVPGPHLPAPSAQIWLDMARLVNGGSLPPHVLPYCLAAAAATALLPIATFAAVAALPRLTAVGRGYSAVRAAVAAFRHAAPSGVAFAVGMYISPRWTLPRLVGSLVEQAWAWVSPESHRSLMLVVASGLVLGEGTASVVLALQRALFGSAT